MSSRLVVAAFTLALLSTTGVRIVAQNALPSGVTGRERIVGGPCEGCEAVFDGIPDSIPALSRIGSADEPGDSMHIAGRVNRADGSAAPGIVVYVWHTDSAGNYPPVRSMVNRPGYRHGRLRGWARSDDNGDYRFETTRPASYPDSDIPQHVHMMVVEPGSCAYYIDEIEFTDDPLLTAEMQREQTGARGGSGIATPKQDREGVWHVTRDIVLGQEIPGYPNR